MRSIVYRFDGLAALGRALRQSEGGLAPPQGERIADQEWVLAVFEIGGGGLETAVAARGQKSGLETEGVVLGFEGRDREQLRAFAQQDLEEAGPETPQRITLPSAMPPPMPPEPAKDHDTERPGARPSSKPGSARVLVVDDDVDIRDVVGAMLEAVGLIAESAASAEEAIDLVSSSSYDLLVLDWNLPGMSGLDLCRHVRNELRLSALPVLFLTAHASTSDVVEAFASGADDFVMKPFRAPELGARIFGLLRRARIVSSL